MKDVEWHTRFLDALGAGDDAKVVIHIGSMADGRDTAIGRFVRTVAALSADVIDACFSTWQARDGIPKVHLSSQVRGGRAGHHADWVRARDVTAFLDAAPRRPFDAMLEARRKDQALVRLRHDLARLGIVESGRAAPRARARGTAPSAA